MISFANKPEQKMEFLRTLSMFLPWDLLVVAAQRSLDA